MLMFLARATSSRSEVADGPGLRDAVLKLSIHALLIIDVLYTSRLYRVVTSSLVQPLLLGSCVAYILIFTALAVVRSCYGVALLVIASYGLIVFQLFVFADRYDVAIDFNAGFQFIWLLTFVVAFMYCQLNLGNYLVKTMVRYATAYSFLYLAIVLLTGLSVISMSYFDALVAEDMERGARIFCYSIAVSYACFYWLRRSMLSKDLKSVLTMLVCVSALLVAQSRMVTLLAIGVAFLGIMRISTWWIRSASLAILWVGSASSWYGLLDPRWNPYQAFANDSSGSFRIWEYDLARQLIQASPVTGIGFPPSQWHAWSFLNYNYFSANDLGTFGVWFDWGLIGLVLFMGASHLATSLPSRMPNRYGYPLFQTGCLMAAYGVTAPVLFYPAGASYFAILFGIWLHGRAAATSHSHRV